LKNAINYFYNIILDDIHQNDKYYYFNYNNNHYVLISYKDDPNLLNDIYNLHINLLKNKINVHEIILNKDNQIITIINGLPYILMKVKYYKGKINYNNVASFFNIPSYIITNINSNNKKPPLLQRDNWNVLWQDKNDYLEYQINQLGQKYKNLRDSFSYYIGMGETSIALVLSLPTNSIKTISHKRINSDDTVFDLYNPLNLIIDNRVRDLAEYFKTSFFNNKNIIHELNHFITNSNLNKTEHLLFLARMLYPTYYFDLFENVISGKKDDAEIKKITRLTSDYERLLKNLYKYYKNIFNIQPIEWLDKY